MNAAQQQLARSLVEHPAWRWMPGMCVTYAHCDEAFRVCEVPAYVDGLYHAHGTAEDWDVARDGEVPDLTDPATVGCLLALAREVWGDPGAYAVGSDVHGWTVCVLVVAGDATNAWPCSDHRHATEGEAIAHAILAAPTKETT